MRIVPLVIGALLCGSCASFSTAPEDAQRAERLFFMHEEWSHSCRKDESCIDPKNVASSKASPLKQRDAEELIRFLVAADAYRSILVPGWGESPRYLMPAASEMYSDPALLAAALYRDLLPLLEKGVTVSRPGLNERLRKIGQKLDEELLPQFRESAATAATRV